ncbi:MAG: S-layer homology domain-containing protein [Lawsonibacter sp.]|nr:S-layer homology domain-containing protein [Lawsonibacter sp.]
MKKLLSAALALTMMFTLAALPAAAAPGEKLEDLAYQNLESASPEQKAAILAAREKIIYGGQSWTVDGSLSLIDLETGAVTPLPEFSDLFPGWDLPAVQVDPPADADLIQESDKGVNANLHNSAEIGFGPAAQFAAFWGSGKAVTVTPKTGPRAGRCNLGVCSGTRQTSLGWAFGLDPRQQALQVSTEQGSFYSLRGNVFTQESQGFYHVSVAGAGSVPGQTEDKPSSGYLDQRTVHFPAGHTWKDGSRASVLPMLDQDLYIHVSPSPESVPYHMSISTASTLLAWYPNLIPGQTGAVFHGSKRLVEDLCVSAAQAADMELIISSQPTPGITYIQANPFADIPQDADYLDAVLHAYAEGLLFGTDTNTFSPDLHFTRAMMWAVMARLDGAQLQSGSPWYAPAREWAMAGGVSDGTAPDRPVSLQEAVAMLHRYLGSPAPNRPVDVNEYGPVSDWALDAMRWALSTNFLYNVIDHTAPTASLTRADLAVLLSRFAMVP